MLRKVPFFGGLDPAKLKLLAFTSRALRFAAGEDLMRLGDPADSAYVIIEGDVEIIGPTPTPGRVPRPSRTPATRAASRRVNSSATSRWT